MLALKGNGAIDQYIFLPDIGQVTKISGDSKSGYFLGSDFTFEDLLREIPGNFKYERKGDTVIHGAECYTIRAFPTDGSAGSYYSYREFFIKKETFMLHQIEFYGPGDKLLKVLEAFEYNSSAVKGETVRPRHAVMTNMEKNSVTIFNVVESRLNLELDADLFTPKAIKNWTAEEVRDLIFDYGFTVTAE